MNYGLKDDARQWLQYDDEGLGAVMRGLEAMALQMVGQSLVNSPAARIDAVRAMGYFMQKVASHRLASMMKVGGAQGQVVSHLAKIMNWLSRSYYGASPALPPQDELDEIYAYVFRLDSRANGAGVGEPLGTHRIAVRGD